MTPLAQAKISNLDHLGLVAGIIDQLGLVELINEHLGVDPREVMSAGVVVKAMILNGLGCVSAPLYLFSRFFEGKAIEHLLGAGVRPEYLNDDRLGRVLDQLWLKGLEQCFLAIALQAVKVFAVSVNAAHLDSTSFHLHGEYLRQQAVIEIGFKGGAEANQAGVSDSVPLEICHGYSRDHRPDLKQFVMNLICCNDGGIPLFLQMGNGNQVDNQVFARLLRTFAQQWQFEGVHVADAALYSEENIQQLDSLRWVSRVPLTLKLAQQLLDEIEADAFSPSVLAGYQLAGVERTYGGIAQRWVVVRSHQRRQADLKQLDQQLQRASQQATQKLKTLSAKSFDCPVLARAAAQTLSESLSYHSLSEIELIEQPHYKKAGRPRAGEPPCRITYRLQATVTADIAAIERKKKRCGCFILATNVVKDRDTLTPDAMLMHYKQQQAPERGFRFCKDPQFFADSVFLKDANRIAALGLIMGLCLLIYSLAERHLRQALAQKGETLPNQLGKPTARPTLRWIFQCFYGVHVLVLDEVKQVVNLTAERLRILEFFPDACRRYYMLC